MQSVAYKLLHDKLHYTLTFEDTWPLLMKQDIDDHFNSLTYGGITKYTATCQLRCILSARLHRVFGCDLSVDSQLQCDLSAVLVDCVDNCSQLG